MGIVASSEDNIQKRRKYQEIYNDRDIFLHWNQCFLGKPPFTDMFNGSSSCDNAQCSWVAGGKISNKLQDLVETLHQEYNWHQWPSWWQLKKMFTTIFYKQQ